MLETDILIISESKTRLVKQLKTFFESKNIKCVVLFENKTVDLKNVKLIIGVHDSCKQAFDLAIIHRCKVVLIEPDFLDDELKMLFSQYYTIVYSTAIIKGVKASKMKDLKGHIKYVIYDSNYEIIELCYWMYNQMII